jgi:murein DD-endopeptidase MepM/ murein hydrolase activator NlpD
MDDRTTRLFRQTNGGTFGLMPVTVEQKPEDYRIELLDEAGRDIATASVRLWMRISEVERPDRTEPRRIETVAEGNGNCRLLSGIRSPKCATGPSRSLPVHSCMTSPFGVQRYLNGKSTGGFHGGMDQRSATGTSVHAISGGMVKIVREWNLHGRTIGIDHGQGLESVYLHMSNTRGDRRRGSERRA